MKRKFQILTALLMSFALGVSATANTKTTKLKGQQTYNVTIENFTKHDFLLNICYDNKNKNEINYSNFKDVKRYGLNTLYVKHNTSFFKCGVKFAVNNDSEIDLKVAESSMLKNNKPDYIKFLLSNKHNFGYIDNFGDIHVEDNFSFNINSIYTVDVIQYGQYDLLFKIRNSGEKVYNYNFTAINYTKRDVCIKLNSEKSKVLPDESTVDKTDIFGGIKIPAETDSFKGDINIVTSANEKEYLNLGLKCWYSCSENKIGETSSYLSNKTVNNVGGINNNSITKELIFNMSPYAVNMFLKFKRGIYVKITGCVRPSYNGYGFLIEVCDKEHPPKSDSINYHNNMVIPL